MATDKTFTTDAKVLDNQVGTVKTFTSDGSVATITPVDAGPLFFALTQLCNVQRRSSNPSYDSMNAPDYGPVKDWPTVYVNIPCRLEIKILSSAIQFKPTGERIQPQNVLYVDASTPLNVEDRVFILNNSVPGLEYAQEFIVQGTNPALNMIGLPYHHLEYELIVP